MKVDIYKLKSIRDYLYCCGFEKSVDEINEFLQKHEYPESKKNYEALQVAGIKLLKTKMGL